MSLISRFKSNGSSISTHLLIISILFPVIFILTQPSRGFWCPDNGYKFIMAQSIIESDFESADLKWKGSEIWDNKEINPIAPPFSVTYNNRIISMFPPFFSLLAAIVLKLTGYWGLHLFALAGTLLTLRSIYKIATLLGMKNPGALSLMWITFSATPFLFYTFTFWEHTLVAGFCLWAVLRVLIYLRETSNKNLIIFVLSVVPAVYLRDVAVIFTASITLLLILHTPRQKIVITTLKAGSLFLIAILPLFLINYLLIGDPLGPHMTYHLKTSSTFLIHLQDRIPVLYNLFVSSFGNITVAVIYVLLNAGIVVFINISYDKKYHKKLLRIYFLVLAFISLIILAEFLAEISSPFYSNSLFGVTPFLFAGFIKTGKKSDSFLRRLMIVYPALYALAAPYLGSTGFHWGCRFLLPLYPLLVYMVLRLLEANQEKILKRCFYSAVISSILLQGYSLILLNTHKTMVKELNEFVKNRPEKTVIALWDRYTHYLPYNFYNKACFNIASREQKKHLNTLIGKIREKGEDRFLIISKPSGFKNYPSLKTVTGQKNNISLEYKILSFSTGSRRPSD